MAGENKRPTHRVYSVVPRPTKDDPNNSFWHQVGSAFPNQDGKGFNIVLDVAPIPRDGKIQLSVREIKEDDEEPESPPARRNNNRR